MAGYIREKCSKSIRVSEYPRLAQGSAAHNEPADGAHVLHLELLRDVARHARAERTEPAV